jgi:PAS domain S-box-containing protein
MRHQDKTKKQLINELTAMRQRVAELEEIEFEREQAELALRESRRYSEAIIETVREALVVLDARLKVLSVNGSFCDTFRVTSGETIGSSIFDLGDGQWDIPALRKLLEDILPANTKFDNFEVNHVFPTIGHKIMRLNARRIYQEGIGTQKILLAIEDITEQRQGELQLKVSETRYRRLFETAQDGILILDADTGHINEVNPFLVDMLGYTPAEFLGKKLWEIGAFKDTKASKAAFAELQSKGYIRYEDLPLTTRDGREIAVEFVSNAYLVDHHKVIQCNIRDISDRKKAEEALQKAHDELEQRVAERTAELQEQAELLNLTHDAIIVRDLQNRILFWNKGAEETYGWKSDEVRGKVTRNLLQTKLPEPWEKIQEKLILHGRWDGEIVHIARDGRKITVASRQALRRDKEGNPIAILAISSDITEQKRAGAAARESQERFRHVAENAGDFIWEVDADGLYRYASPSVEKILGYRPDELNGKIYFYDLFMPEVREELKTAAFNLFAAKQPFRTLPNPNLSKDGRVVQLETSGSPVLDAAGNLTGYIGVDSDVTERQKLEAQLHQAEKMEALGTLAGGIAHDFNNLLAAIMGFSELVKETLPKGSREERRLEMVVEASLRGRELIKHMLTFSRQTPQEKKPLQLSSIVKETGKFLRASIPSTISVRINVESESGLVLGDPVQIEQVLMNLCTNAAHAMREKGGSLDIEVNDFSVSPSNGDPHGIAPGRYMRLVVRDSGTGIPREIMDKIFDPFFTTKPLGEGTGLGLSVVMGIVKQSQGYITAESEPGKGSTFTVLLPQFGKGAIIDEIVTVEPIPTGSERILYVDDEALVVMMGEALLRQLGYEVTSHTRGRKALEVFRNDPFRFDLVITDQTMPEMTGFELAKEILALRPEIPVILCTGFSYLVDDDPAKVAGIKGFVMKPFTKGEIARTVRKALDG